VLFISDKHVGNVNKPVNHHLSSLEKARLTVFAIVFRLFLGESLILHHQTWCFGSVTGDRCFNATNRKSRIVITSSFNPTSLSIPFYSCFKFAGAESGAPIAADPPGFHVMSPGA
jgi:hypothetical protein